MAYTYNETGHITLGQLKTSLERVKTEYETADAEITASSEEVATDDETTKYRKCLKRSSERL